jgi:uncharacterized protein YecE (DUF72 family)
MALRVGCCGFPVSQREYASRLSVVEVQQTFYQPPRVATAKRWRELAPGGFEFTLKAWQLITHEPSSPTYRRLAKPVPPERSGYYGSFRDTDEVWQAWLVTAEIAQALGARVILFQCPASFTPTEAHKRDLRRFMGKLPRGQWIYAFEPRGVWEDEEVGALCRDLDLVHAVDPLRTEPSTGKRLGYFRLHGPQSGRYRYDDEDLGRLARKCEGFEDLYCMFNNVEMWRDAARFLGLIGR